MMVMLSLVSQRISNLNSLTNKLFLYFVVSSTVTSETSPINGTIKTELKSETFDDTNSPLDQLLNSTQSQLFLFQVRFIIK